MQPSANKEDGIQHWKLLRKVSLFCKKNKNPVTYCNYLHLRDIKTTRTLTMIYTCMTIVIQSNLNEFSDETQTVM